MSLGDIGSNLGRAVSNGVHNAGHAVGNVVSSMWGKIASIGAKLSTVPVGPILVGGSVGVGLISIGTATISMSLEPGVYENYYDTQNSVTSYMEELKEDGSRDVEIQFSSTNAAVKAYYSVISGKTLWQLQDDGTLINATDTKAKKDYFDREPYLFLTPNFLYALNETMYGNSLVYPEQFAKPVAYTYEDEVLSLQDLVKDKKVVVESVPIDLTTGKQKENKTVTAVSDYGFGSVAKYKQDTLTKSLEGTYIKQDVWDDTTLSVIQQDIEEDFVYVLSTDEIDVLDTAVTVAGVVSFDYTVEKKLSANVTEGQSDKISDAVTKVLYETKKITFLRAKDKNGNIVENVTQAWCDKNGYTPIYTATIKNKDGSVSTVSDVTEEWAKKNGYTIVVPPSIDVKLYKYRSADSGVFSESCTPVENQTLYDEKVGLEYVQDYMINFESYFPIYKSRIYGHLEDISTVANVEAYQKTAESTNGTGTEKANFIESIKQKALEYQKTTGISAAVIIAQACLESGALSGGSELSNPPNNNYFGIKAFSDWKGKKYTGWTTEVYNGVKVRVRADFRAYDAPGDCFEDYCKLIWNQTYGTPGKYRYREAAGKSWKEAIETIVKGGYCTDPNYVSKIEHIVNTYNLAELENDPNYQWDGTPPSFAKSDDGSGSGGVGDTDGTLYKYTGNLTKEETDIFNNFLFRFVNQDKYTDNDLLNFAPNGAYRKYHKSVTSGEFNSMLLTVLTFTNHTLRSEEDIKTVSLWYDGFVGQKRDKNENARYIGEGDWWWVVPSSFTITSKFGPRSSPTAGASSDHKGIDIAATTGADIIATRAGKVIVSQFSNSEGYWIAIDHGDGFISMYMHNSELLVKVGDDVEQGQVIAKAGSTGVSTGPHLHFAITKDGEYVNPEDYVSPANTPTKESDTSGDGTSDIGSSSSLRNDMVKWALSKVGNHYVYGGTNPNCKYWGKTANDGKCSGGTDCSGFTQAIYKEFGMSISRTAASQCSDFKHIQKKDLKPGDLLFYKDSSGSIGHVSMYVGNNKVVHASSSKSGIIISDIGYRTPAYYGRCKLIAKTEKSYNKSSSDDKDEDKKEIKTTEDATTESKKSKKKSEKESDK